MAAGKTAKKTAVTPATKRPALKKAATKKTAKKTGVCCVWLHVLRRLRATATFH
jgi:hypothetical protein